MQSQSGTKREQAAKFMKACAKEMELASEYCLDAFLTR